LGDSPKAAGRTALPAIAFNGIPVIGSCYVIEMGAADGEQSSSDPFAIANPYRDGFVSLAANQTMRCLKMLLKARQTFFATNISLMKAPFKR